MFLLLSIHACGILLLVQACPKTPCIYTSNNWIYLALSGGMLENPERSGTKRNPEVIDARYGRRRRTPGQKLALIRTVCVCVQTEVQTRILRSVTATMSGQAPAESHVKHINCWGKIQPAMGSVMGHVSLQVAQWNRKRFSHSVVLNKTKQAIAQAK